ncbi:MAG: hypothetical protein ACTS8Z_03755 [Candidatus Limnocylindrales bacterium]
MSDISDRKDDHVRLAMIEADALVVHLNPLQELIGPEIRSCLAAVDPAESARSV